MTTYKRNSSTEWEWQKGSRHHTVRYFASTDKLIWSGYTDTSNGPVFEDGYAQAVENFLQDSVPHLNPPQALLDELHDVLSDYQKQEPHGFFSWFKRGNK